MDTAHHSARADGRGGWTPGKRRNRVDPVRLAVALGALRTLLATPRRGEVSVRALAGYLGVSDRTVRRWLSGEDLPPAGAVRRICWRQPGRTRCCKTLAIALQSLA